MAGRIVWAWVVLAVLLVTTSAAVPHEFLHGLGESHHCSLCQLGHLPVVTAEAGFVFTLAEAVAAVTPAATPTPFLEVRSVLLARGPPV